MTIATPTARRRRRMPDVRHLDAEEIYELAEQLQGRPVPGVRMSEAEFEAWALNRVDAEWVNGGVVLMVPANIEHDDLDLWLSTLVRVFIEEHDLGVAHRDIFVRFAGQRRRRVPDLLFVRSDRINLLKPTYLDGAPDLIFEIISPDSQSRDRREKHQEYEKAGVREYWIIDPLSKTVEAYRLEGKKFQLVPEQDGMIASAVLRNFTLRTEWFWRKPLPKVSAVLKQMRGKSARR